MSASVEEKLYEAVWDGRAFEVSSLLRDYPEINVNWTDNHWTPLHITSFFGFVEVVKLLLAHPHIDVNLENDDGQTPLLLACHSGNESVFEVLLKDPRVDVTLDDNKGRTPLWWASCHGNYELAEWLIASGKDLGDIEKRRNWEGNEYSALEIAREFNNTEVVPVLERFVANPALTRHEVRVKLGMLDDLAAEVFALTVFLCDELLHLKPASHLAATPDHATAATATRFFAIAKRLPMELQMILCHRVLGSKRQNILRKDSEAAFKSLARILLLFD